MRNHRHLVAAALTLLVSAAACQKSTPNSGPSTGSGSSTTTASAGSGSGAGSAGSGGMAAPAAPAAPPKDIDSKDILARTETSPEVQVKHVLIGWKDLAGVYGPRMDARAKNRTNEEAAKLAQDIAAKLKAAPDQIDAISKESSEDPGSQSGEPYTIKADAPFVEEFKKLSLRLKMNEVGIVKTQFGYHVIERVTPPPPDPLESADILARPAEAGPAQIEHVLIGWKDTPAAHAGRGDPKSKDRTKEEADKIAKDVLEKARKGGDMKKLMKEFSEDPGSRESGKPYEVTADAQMVEPFKNMALRLKMNEVGLVKSPFGWHVMKRVPPPPPDPLESADILKREPPAEKVKVKHILLGWTEAHTDDERGSKRSRADLEKLVKETVAKLKKGDKIEDLMSSLSEDPGSAKTGKDYDVTPAAGMVAPFKNLSLRLKVKEVGVVKSDFGIHIIQRIE
ncbi:MAG TPA: peptidylprolyl isomerase [Kofleriaceae bacterium]|nr:peptidylprolyl isomerase [Kofleriaceae bacterium]